MGAIVWIGPLRGVFCAACGRRALGAEITLHDFARATHRCTECLRAIAEAITARLKEMPAALPAEGAEGAPHEHWMCHVGEPCTGGPDK